MWGLPDVAEKQSDFERSKMEGSRVQSPFTVLPLLGALVLSNCGGQAIARATSTAPRILEARSDRYTILDGGDRLPGTLSVAADPDVYIIHPTDRSTEVTYLFGEDRLSLRLTPGQSVDFGVRYAGHLYRHRVTTVDPNPPAYRGRAAAPGGVDAIPFTLGAGNSLHIRGSINGSRPLHLIFDTGAGIGVIAEDAMKKGVLRREGETNQIELGTSSIGALPMVSIDFHGTLKADGVVGFDAFAGKVVSIDYGRRLLLVSHDRPTTGGYRQVPLIWRGAQALVPVTLRTPCGPTTLNALFDTGSRWSLSLRNVEPLVSRCSGFSQLGTRVASKSDGTRMTMDVVTMPSVEVGGIVLRNAQAEIERPGAASQLANSIAGNDLLKRFDAIIDYRASQAFLRPNGLVDAPYNRVFPMRLAVVGATLSIGSLLLLAWMIVRRRRRRARSVATSDELRRL